MHTRSGFISSILFLTAAALNAGSILVNKAGYLVNSTKTVYLTESQDSFYVNDVSRNEIVFKGKSELRKTNDPATGLTIYIGDFTSCKEPGKYFITDNFGNKSSEFEIGDNVFEPVFAKSLKGFYFQRCGCELKSKFAGVYAHPVCHFETDGTFHGSTDTTGHSDVTGGWHDAGDYGKYVVNAGITLGTLLMAYEMFPEKFSADDLNIPESGNKIPDILDECRYELNWLFKMQKADGQVYHKVTRETFAGFVMPQDDSVTRYIYRPSSTATADFVSVMARAYRVFKKFDQEYAEKCLGAAEKSWSYLQAHPGIFPAFGFRNPEGTRTGVYGDRNDSDERLWAAAELFECTGDSLFKSYYENNYKKKGLFAGLMTWPNVTDMAHLTYLFGEAAGTDPGIKAELKTALINFCDSLVQKSESDGMNIVITPGQYKWGSNSEVLNGALILIAGFQLTNNNEYYETALDQLNYILGTNANDISYITGVGDKHIMHPHHRPSGADDIAEPVPGLLSGGPDQYLSDAALRAKFTRSTPPALCFLDELPSFASNEICLNWNAPLVFVAGWFNNSKKP